MDYIAQSFSIHGTITVPTHLPLISYYCHDQTHKARRPGTDQAGSRSFRRMLYYNLNKDHLPESNRR